MLAGGSPRYGLYRTADEKVVAVGALEQKFWDSFCETVGLPWPLRDDRRDPAATRQAVVELIRARPAEEWRRLLGPVDCCCTVLASLEEAVADEQFRGRGLFNYQLEQDGHRMPMTPLPIAPSFRPGAEFDRRVAAAGAHTTEVLHTEG
jgi:crotonobetainyl-CoA:carnitine CoA-transferase CaiB-like acyl-CoA transferase